MFYSSEPGKLRRPLNVALNHPPTSRPTLPLPLEQEELSDLPKVMLTLMTFSRESSVGHRRLLPSTGASCPCPLTMTIPTLQLH